jgi:hypothetical protein
MRRGNCNLPFLPGAGGFAFSNAQKVTIINGVTNLNGLGLCALTGPDAPLCVGVLGSVAAENSLTFWVGGQVTIYDAETKCLQGN